MIDSNQRDEQERRFEYRHLKHREIRILDLFLAEDDNSLKGIIRNVPISQAGAFIAVSYVWGAQSAAMNGYYLDTPHGKVPLTFSLHSALRALRKRSTLPVWADGICINQDDLREKALQIGMMGQIFQTAQHVVAWLGHDYDGSQEAMGALTHIHDKTTSNHEDIPWQSINSLLERPWFRRVWITQELMLPSKVTLMCGQSEMDWDDFFESLIICESEANQGVSPTSDDIKLLPAAGPVYALGIARRRLRSEGKRHGLLKWFELFSHAKASVEVDKLFAFIAISHDGDAEDFTPDYESTREEVIRRYAKGFLLQGQAMELLYRAGTSKSYDFCSWIPRWTEGEFPKTISTWEPQQGSFFAGSQSAPTYSIAGARIPQCVVLNGYIVDTVHSRHSIQWGSDTSFFFFDAMIDFRTLLSYVEEYPTGESPDDVLLQLPIGNAARPHLESDLDNLRAFHPFATEDHRGWPSDLRKLILSVGYDRDPAKYWDLPQESRNAIERYWLTARAFSQRLGTASLCFTKGRFVGLVPEAALADDLICVFDGGRVPFVVRKRGPAYTLIGECYVHGMMHGEALQLPGKVNRSITLV